jgi:alpha-glucosidase
MRSLRKLVASYPGDRVLIGETYLPNIQELDKWYGGAGRNELNLPMDMQIGFINKLDASLFRQRIEDVETKVHGNQPLIVFDNHDNPRSWDRYGDGVHDAAIARVIATMLFTTRATAMMYYGQEIGMVTTPPKRKEDVKDPVGLVGWPKEKGRDGERTPMQWDTSKNAGFSTADETWLPVAPNYKTVNVQVEDAASDSLLNWYKQLIQMRATNPALREGPLTMLDRTNPNVLSYVRKGSAGSPSVVVALNFTAQPQTISLNLTGTGVTGTNVKTLLTDDASLRPTTSLAGITLPPFASWIASVQ